MNILPVLMILLGLNILTICLRYQNRDKCVHKPTGKLIAFFWIWNTAVTLLVCFGMFMLGKLAIEALEALPAGSTDTGAFFQDLMITTGNLVVAILLFIGILTAVIIVGNLTNLTFCSFCLWKRLKTGVFSTIVQVMCSIICLTAIVLECLDFLKG